jgi:hypothetical protein
VVRLIFSLFFACCLGAEHCCAGSEQGVGLPPSRVFYGSDPAMLDGYQADASAVETMTDRLVMDVTGQRSVAAAWRTMVGPGDHIGIKIDAAGGLDFSTHRPIVMAVLRGLSEAGVPMSQVVIFDRADPAAAGYADAPDGAAVRRIDPITGYEPKAAVMMPVIGRLIWGDLGFQPRDPNPLALIRREQYSAESHWSRLICGLNKIINIPVMSASEDCGMAGCIYNLTVPNVDNWRRFVNPPECGDPYLAQLYADDHIKPKVIINIMDGLIAQYGGGPDWQPDFSWRNATIYASKDPVAIDATALRLLEVWRKDAGLPDITPSAKYLQTAESMGLGNYNQTRIELVRESR